MYVLTNTKNMLDLSVKVTGYMKQLSIQILKCYLNKQNIIGKYVWYREVYEISTKWVN